MRLFLVRRQPARQQSVPFNRRLLSLSQRTLLAMGREWR